MSHTLLLHLQSCCLITFYALQELLPDHLLKEAKAAADRTKGAKVQWPFGWGKKKEPDQEPSSPPDPETLKVNTY